VDLTDLPSKYGVHKLIPTNSWIDYGVIKILYNARRNTTQTIINLKIFQSVLGYSELEECGLSICMKRR